MRNQKLLLLHQLDQKFKPFNVLSAIYVPEKGWINTVRKALNMTFGQLGNRLNITSQGVKKMEEREASEAITIRSLREAGKALDMQLVYGFVPMHGSMENLVNRKAEELAKKIVLRTDHTMKLENQGNSQKQVSRAIKELAEELKREMRKSRWD